MAFQLPTTTAAPASGALSFSFGLNTGSPAPAAAAPAAAAVPATKPTFAFGSPAGAPNLGGGDADTAKVQNPPAFSGFGLGGATVTPTLGGSLGGQPSIPVSTSAPPIATVAAPPAFGGFLSQPAAAATAVSVAPTSAPATVAPIGGILSGLGAVKSTASATPLTAAPTAIAPQAGAGPAPTLNTGGAFANLTTETKTTDSAAISTATQLSYNQLEEHINKWTLEFEEQEKVFTEQATQINAWDKLLISNNHKIVELNDAVKKVKTDQQVLDQELEFIATQHKELEESLAPLEKEFVNLPRLDMERSQTYLMVENLDTQLKQMSEDLKEIIDNLNEANKGQDTTDPIIQIGKILNAHMSSLQWIETQSSNICRKLDDIGKIHDTQKRDIFRAPF